MIEFQDVKSKVVIKDEAGKCLNCGVNTHFYDEGYFCTCYCRKDYIRKKLYKNIIDTVDKSFKEINKYPDKLTMTEEEFKILVADHERYTGREIYNREFMGIPIEII